jgi:predicted dehydrogenase
MVKSMSVAFVGAGRRSVESARMLAASGIGRPVGFWNRTRVAAESAAQEFSTPVFDDVGDLVEATKPDLVAVMTHPSARSALVEQAAQAGARAILVEKPVALSEGELAAVERAADGCFVMINTQYQWMPHWQRYLALIAAGEIGDIVHIRASVGVDILEQGPHALSLALAAADAGGLSTPTWVLAAGDGTIDFGGVPVPANSTALYDLGDARLTLTAGQVAPPVRGETVRAFQQQTEILGSRGRIWVSLNQGSELWTDGAFESVPTGWTNDDVASQTGLFSHIARALKDPTLQDSFPTRLEVAAGQARLLFGAIAAIKAGSRVSLNASPGNEER